MSKMCDYEDDDELCERFERALLSVLKPSERGTFVVLKLAVLRATRKAATPSPFPIR
jgi:hypothetical protein